MGGIVTIAFVAAFLYAGKRLFSVKDWGEAVQDPHPHKRGGYGSLQAFPRTSLRTCDEVPVRPDGLAYLRE